MQKPILLLLLLVFVSVHLQAQVDSNEVRKNEIKKQAIDLRNKVNEFVNQSTSRTSTQGGNISDSMFVFLIELNHRMNQLAKQVDSVKAIQLDLQTQNKQLNQKIILSQKYSGITNLISKGGKQFTVYFMSGSTQIDSLFLTEIMNWLSGIPAGKKLKIKGFADDLGDDRLNKNLSQNRAEAILQLIKEKQLENTIGLCKGYGEIYSNNSESKTINRQLSRKVEISF